MKRYIVTKGSKDGTFRKGDHIIFFENGDVGCVEAEGWIDAEDTEEAMKGMEYEVDEEWMKKRQEYLRKQLELLEKNGE